jgi:hypothetical protein
VGIIGRFYRLGVSSPTYPLSVTIGNHRSFHTWLCAICIRGLGEDSQSRLLADNRGVTLWPADESLLTYLWREPRTKLKVHTLSDRAEVGGPEEYIAFPARKRSN